MKKIDSRETKIPAGEPLRIPIPELCRLAGISRGTFYKLRQAGLGPRESRIPGVRRVMVMRADAIEWISKIGEKEAA